MSIYTFIAYDDDKDLGRAYNESMSLLNDEDWAVFIDHDAMFVQPYWYYTVKEAIEGNPDVGFFTCLTNRIGCPWMRLGGIDVNNHDIHYHRQIGKQLTERETEVVDVTNQSVRLSGVVMICQKKVWDTIGGAKSGFLSVDNDLHDKCAKNGIKVGLISNLYAYHWYRGDGDRSHLS